MTTEKQPHEEKKNGATKDAAWNEAKAASADASRLEKSEPRVGRYDVPLAPIERLALGQKIAALDADVEKLEADKKGAVAEWNGRIEKAAAELRAHCATLRKGAEERDVRVVDIKDFGTNTYRVVDAEDESKIYFERALGAHERQADLLAQNAIKKATATAHNPAETKDEPAPEPGLPLSMQDDKTDPPAVDASSFDGGAEPPTEAAAPGPKKASKKRGEEPETT